MGSWSGAHFAGVRPLVMEASAEGARLEILADLEGELTGDRLRASLADPNGTVVAEAEEDVSGDQADLTLNVEKPELWWPRGHGKQPLYILTLGEATWQGRVGLRTAELDTTPDNTGAAFTLKVNGKPIFCKGANWIPDDCFPTALRGSASVNV